MKSRLDKLLSIKSLVTLAMTGVFCILALKGVLTGQDFPDICKVKVVILCKDVLPIIYRNRIFILVLVSNRLHNGVAILGRRVTCDLNTSSESIIESKYIRFSVYNLICNSCKVLTVTALVTHITESVQKITVSVVGEES